MNKVTVLVSILLLSFGFVTGCHPHTMGNPQQTKENNASSTERPIQTTLQQSNQGDQLPIQQNAVTDTETINNFIEFIPGQNDNNGSLNGNTEQDGVGDNERWNGHRGHRHHRHHRHYGQGNRGGDAENPQGTNQGIHEPNQPINGIDVGNNNNFIELGPGQNRNDGNGSSEPQKGNPEQGFEGNKHRRHRHRHCHRHYGQGGRGDTEQQTNQGTQGPDQPISGIDAQNNNNFIELDSEQNGEGNGTMVEDQPQNQGNRRYNGGRRHRHHHCHRHYNQGNRGEGEQQTNQGNQGPDQTISGIDAQNDNNFIAFGPGQYPEGDYNQQGSNNYQHGQQDGFGSFSGPGNGRFGQEGESSDRRRNGGSGNGNGRGFGDRGNGQQNGFGSFGGRGNNQFGQGGRRNGGQGDQQRFGGFQQ